MAGKSQKDDQQALSEQRTDWSEDRTILANERTYGGWMRTGLASVGLGLAVNAVFQETEPTYAAKAVATGFIFVGILIFIGAFRKSRTVLQRLEAHSVKPVGERNMALATALMILASIALCIVLWTL